MASAGTMDFFARQDAARRKTSVLIAYYVLAVMFIIAGIYLTVSAALLGVKIKTEPGAKIPFEQLWNLELCLWVVGITLLIVLGGSLYKIKVLSGGGAAIAEMLGGRPINTNTRNADERKILNVVEEMSIASGTSVPRVFIMENESGINAFAAGFTPSSAVIAVTKGCVEQLSRDELQGVIAHEFSHILNGDMRLNIRLVGILHGILIIGLLGYLIFRSSLYSSGHSRGKGNSIPIVLIGLAIMIIGYVGVFFGKLIKSAVSRQREFLADASAVQFTRNPDGICGALKKIGGFSKGSKIQTTSAEEASHFFFADGLTASFMNLMATHPPLKERILRMDPSFSMEREKKGRGIKGRAPSQAKEQDTDDDDDFLGGLDTPLAAVSGFAVQSADVVASVGAPQAKHIKYAARLLGALPDDLTERAREPFSARAIVYSLLLNKESKPRKIQLQHLAKYTDKIIYRETERIVPLVEKLAPELRLPLLDLAISALKALSPSQYKTFRANVACLVKADKKIDLFEFTLQRMISGRLEPIFKKSKPEPIQYYAMEPLLNECTILLSCLAHWGGDSAEDAKSAFDKGAERLGAGSVPEIIPAGECGLDDLSNVLDKLKSASPAIKKSLIDACTECIAMDGKVTITEAEVLRIIGDSLDCPIPPLLPGQDI